MVRAVYGAGNRRKHKKIIKQARGYYGRAKNCFRTAIQRVEKGLQYAYRDRRTKKRTMRALWIQRINAGTRQHGMRYSTFMNGLKKSDIQIDRKVLAHMAATDATGFKALVDAAKKAVA